MTLTPFVIPGSPGSANMADPRTGSCLEPINADGARVARTFDAPESMGPRDKPEEDDHFLSSGG